jgi:competence protein ComEC
VTVLDVGQGDAIVVEAPGGQTLLVDTGPGGGRRLDAGERVVAPFLWNRGVLALSAVVVTHADQDHAGGLAAISRDFSIARTLEAQSRSWVGGLAVTVLAPPPSVSPHRRNDEALVVRLDWGLASFLLASDATAAAERALLDTRVPLDARVLKVAHHGAAGSSTTAFLERVRPSLAVISVGARNPYGHPAPETLARLQSVGARIARTDRDGAVIVETDGRALAITRWATGTVERYCLDPETHCEP